MKVLSKLSPQPSRPALRVWLCALTLAAVLAGLLPPPLVALLAPPLATLTQTLLPPKVALAAGNVTGIVFQDFDADGVDDGTTELGVGGVTVTAYNAAGTAVATATSYATLCFGANNPAGQGCTAANTPALGSYTLNLSAVANATPLRIEFTNLPKGYYPGATATNNTSTVRFVSTTAGAISNVNLSLNAAGAYAPSTSTNVLLVVPIQRGLNNNGALSSSTLSTLNALAYSTTGTPASGTAAANKRPQANRSQTGALFGLASYGNQYVWGGTWFKRHAPIGPGGLGAIYLTEIDSGTPNATLWTTIPNAGVNPRGANESSTLASYWLRDTVAFSSTGKLGLGDVDYAAYNQTLYTVNLHDRHLYAVPVIPPPTSGAAPTAGTPVSITLPLTLPGAATGCASEWLRPGALETYLNQLWVGLTCTGPATGDLRLYLYSLNLDSQSFSSAPLWESTLTGYSRGNSKNDGVLATSAAWNPWEDSTQHITSGSGQNRSSWPQPFLTDIDRDNNGDLILAIRDRNGDQTGHTSQTIDLSNGNFVDGIGAGDLLRACLNASGGWTLESDGLCGSRTGFSTTNNQGPGGGEFYNDNAPSQHDQVALGATAQVPGYTDVVATLYDPLAVNSSEGYRKLSNTNGASTGDTVLTANPGGTGTSEDKDGTYGKSAGLGDIEALLPFAPIEIGNRVWNDADRDGIQDPGEVGIASVVVSLVATDTTTVLATATTDTNGNYYFSSATGTSTASTRYGISGLTAHTSGFIIRTSMTQTNLVDYRLTEANTDTSVGGDQRDSDAIDNAGLAEILVDTGAPGENNHTYDLGFYEVYSVGNRVWNDANNNGLYATTESGIGGVEILLFSDLDNDGTITGSELITPTASTTTDSSGYYRFDELVGGNYLIEIPAGANFDLLGDGPLAGFRSSTGSSTETVAGIDPDTVATDSDDNGKETAGANSAVRSLVFTLGPTGATEPATETDIGPGDEVTIDDGHTNLTVDFGFYLNLPTCTIANNDLGGNIFRDFNANGVKDGYDTRLSGVLVRAYDVSNTNIATTTVRADGTYLFAGLIGTTTPVRIEFSNLPASYESSISATTGATQRGTATQFYSAPFCAANFAAHVPEEYCQSNPSLCTAEMIAGDPQNATTAAFSALKKWNYAAANGAVTPTNLATVNRVGSVWGLAYARRTDKLYSAAFLKRHAGLGPNGLGAIYVTTNPRTGTGVTTALFFDVATVPGINVGSVPSNSARGLTTPTGTALDAAIYDQVGKVGLGDIDLSTDETTLWAVSLNDKKLLGIPVSNPTPATVQVYTIPDPGCTAGSGDYRPFATKYYRNQLYVGVTCDASLSLNRNDLESVVYRFDPANPGAGFTPVLTVPLNYTKGAVNTACTSNPAKQWFPWVNTPYPAGFNPACPAAGNKVLPQPLLSDLEFDLDGSLVLGFIDRFAHQVASGIALSNGTLAGETMGGGEILRAWNNNGVFVLENNGSAGPVSGGVGNNQGPGGGEFYRGDVIASLPTTVMEIAIGGLAFLPGSGETVTSVWDPLTNNAHHGVAFLSNTTGNVNRRHDLNYNMRFGKGAGLGDLELLCDAAPLEIGNRVWRDTDNDGLQDPGEPPIAGVVVSLQVSGTTSNATTNAAGEYYFSSATGASTTDRVLGITALAPNTPFTLTINSVQAPLNGLVLTAVNSDGQATNDPFADGRDSDGQTAGSLYHIVSVTGGVGSNNHTYDWGFTLPAYDLALVKVANPTAVVVGNNVTYTVRIKNQGAVASGLYTVTDRLPSGFGFVSASSSGAHNSGVVTWANLPSLAAGASQDLTLVASVGSTPGTYTNWAEISADSGADEDSTPDTNTGQDNTPPNDLVIDRTDLADVNTDPTPGDEDDHDPATITVTSLPPSYSLGKQLLTPAPVSVGAALTFSMRITNTGNTVITLLPLEDRYQSAYLHYVSASPAPDSTASGLLTWNNLAGGGLAPNASVQVVVRFTALADTSLLGPVAPCNQNGVTTNLAVVRNAQAGATPMPDATTCATVPTLAPTAVTLAERSLSYSAGQVTLFWRTANEAQTSSFNLLRVDLQGNVTQLTEQPLVAQYAGQNAGATYTLVDSTALPGQSYRYVLEVTDLNGQLSYNELGTIQTGATLYLPVVER